MGRGRHVDPVERLRSGADLVRRRFEHDAILVDLGVEHGDLTLAERVVQRVVDRRFGDPEPRRGIAVDHDVELEAVESADPS